MARRSDVMHYTLDLCKDRKARLSGIFGRRRRPLPCQHYGRGLSGRALLAKYGRHADHTAAVLAPSRREFVHRGRWQRAGGRPHVRFALRINDAKLLEQSRAENLTLVKTARFFSFILRMGFDCLCSYRPCGDVRGKEKSLVPAAWRRKDTQQFNSMKHDQGRGGSRTWNGL